jgi:periplasmic protein CpxP/Spy
MKLTKTLAFAALVAGSLLAGTALQAQDSTNTPPAGKHTGGPGMHGRPNIDQMAKELNLTDDQKTKVEAAMQDQQAKMKALHSDTSLSKEDRHAKVKEIHEGFTAKMKEILTPDQFEKWQKHMQHHPHRGGDDNAPKSN